jgi:uncharacterized protein (DUF1697 family)
MSQTTHIGLLRAINLGAHNKVSMGALRELLATIGLQNARTLLLSGNVVFESDGAPAAKLEALLEGATATQLGVATDYFVRSAREWRAIVDANPFPKEAKRDPGHLIMMCLKRAPDRASVAALQRAIKGREVVRANGREAYITYPDGQGRSKLTIAMIEKHLGTRGTARNWNTVLKLAALAEGDS